MSNLKSAIGSLSAAEKYDEADAPPLTGAQRVELDYRVARYEQNPSDVAPWEQVRAGLFKER